jgi:hypothetical protein
MDLRQWWRLHISGKILERDVKQYIEGPSPLPEGPRADHYRRLVAARQAWQGPYWVFRIKNLILVTQISQFNIRQYMLFPIGCGEHNAHIKMSFW